MKSANEEHLKHLKELEMLQPGMSDTGKMITSVFLDGYRWGISLVWATAKVDEAIKYAVGPTTTHKQCLAAISNTGQVTFAQLKVRSVTPSFSPPHTLSPFTSPDSVDKSQNTQDPDGKETLLVLDGRFMHCSGKKTDTYAANDQGVVVPQMSF